MKLKYIVEAEIAAKKIARATRLPEIEDIFFEHFNNQPTKANTFASVVAQIIRESGKTPTLALGWLDEVTYA
jgi:hypothetical protein